MCEDWYHYKHLKPILPEDENPGEDDYVLICQKCIKSQPMLFSKLLNYTEYFHEITLDHLGIVVGESPLKRLKVSDDPNISTTATI